MQTLATALAALTLTQAAPVLERAGMAATIVREAADALGGSGQLQEAVSIRFGIQGEAMFPYQGPAPGQAGAFNYGISITVNFEPLDMKVTSGFTGGETAFSRTIDFDGGSVASQGEFARQLRQSPHALLRAWLAVPQNLILSDQTTTHHVVSGAFHGRLVHAHINRNSGLVERVAVPYDDARHGDALAQAEFSAYRQVDGWMIPDKLRLVEAGNVIFDLAYEHYEVSPGESAVPKGEEGGEPNLVEEQSSDPSAPPAFERPSADTFLHRDYAAGVRVLFNSGGPDYHSLAVATGEGVVVIETPGSTAHGRDLVVRAGELGEVKYLGVTHHHADHSGGAPGAAGLGRTLLVAESHRAFFEDMVTAERRFLDEAFSPVTSPAFEVVAKNGEITLGGRVIAYDAGPTGHSDAHLVFYVPDARLLFQSDMAVFRWDGSVEAAREQTCRLHAFIRDVNLDVEVIAGGHGRPGSMEDLRRAIEQRESGCPDAEPGQ